MKNFLPLFRAPQSAYFFMVVGFLIKLFDGFVGEGPFYEKEMKEKN